MYSDEFIKYPLPIDKSKIDWTKDYMKYGGSQLLEILEKEFDYKRLRTRFVADTNESQYSRLKIFLEYNCDVEKIRESQMFNYSFFWKGAGLLSILIRKINLYPIIQNNKFVSRFSFVKYNVMECELGYLVISDIERDNWYSNTVNDYEKEGMRKIFFYDKDFNSLNLENSISKDMLNVYEVTQIMLGD